MICPNCDQRISCGQHEAEIRTLMGRIEALETELAITQMERAERARQWQCARLEVARLADKVIALQGES